MLPISYTQAYVNQNDLESDYSKATKRDQKTCSFVIWYTAETVLTRRHGLESSPRQDLLKYDKLGNVVLQVM